MNNTSKIILSDEELQLVNNSSLILTKRIIIDKVVRLFGSLADAIKGSMENEDACLPPEVLLSSPKISKGENYLQLPYVLLDYPRCFYAGNVFAVRTMFWWGNFFSMTLHLSGRYKETFADHICRNRAILIKDEFYICVNEDQWQHHFEEDNYRAVKKLSQEQLEQLIGQKPFIKLAVKFSLNRWKEADELMEKIFVDMMKLMKA